MSLGQGRVGSGGAWDTKGVREAPGQALTWLRAVLGPSKGSLHQAGCPESSHTPVTPSSFTSAMLGCCVREKHPAPSLPTLNSGPELSCAFGTIALALEEGPSPGPAPACVGSRGCGHRAGVWLLPPPCPDPQTCSGGCQGNLLCGCDSLNSTDLTALAAPGIAPLPRPGHPGFPGRLLHSQGTASPSPPQGPGASR